VRALLVKGLPMGLQMVMLSAAMIAMISMVNVHGVDTTAGYGAALQLWTYVQMPAMAIGAACSTMAAQNVGAGRWDRVSRIAGTAVAFNLLLTGGLITLLLLLDRAALSLFLGDASVALDTARHLNRIAIWSFLFFGVTFVLFGVVRSTGAVLAPLLILAGTLWGVRVPVATLLQPSLGIDAIWWSFPVSAFVAMLLAIAYYRWGGWRHAHMLGGEEREPVAIPAEVPGQPPSPVAELEPPDTTGDRSGPHPDRP